MAPKRVVKKKIIESDSEKSENVSEKEKVLEKVPEKIINIKTNDIWESESDNSDQNQNKQNDPFDV